MHTPEQLLRTLLDTVPDRIYFKDRDSRFILVNSAMNTFLGAHTDKEFIGKTDHDIFLPEHADEALADEQRVMLTGASVVGKVEKEVRPDGQTSWVSTTKVAMRNEKGEIIGTCGISRDITAEQKLQQLVIQKEKDDLVDSLVGGIAHELNNKVLPLLGFTELLMDETTQNFDKEKIRSYGNIIVRSSMECAAIVRQLLDLRKATSSRPVVCDLGNLTREAISFLMFQFRNSKITVQEHYPPEQVFVRCDPAQVTQIIINLCLNAIEAMEDRPIRTLEVTIEQNGQRAEVQFKDTGTGIAQETFTRIFDPFFTTKRTETAKGLGLTVSRSIAHQFNGEITAHTLPGIGSTFTLQLPLEKNPAPQTAPGEAVTNAGQRVKSDTQPWVLLVDDEEPIGTLIAEILQRKMHMLVDRAANGQEALEKLQQKDYNLVISDIRMPVMSGTDLLKWIQSNKPGQIKHFFFMTGDEGSFSNREIVAHSNVPILHKPFSITALIEFCDEIMKSPPT